MGSRMAPHFSRFSKSWGLKHQQIGQFLRGGSTAAAENPSGTETFSARNLPPPMIRGVSHRVSPVFFLQLGHVSSVKQRTATSIWCISGMFRGQDCIRNLEKNQDEQSSWVSTNCWAAETLCIRPVHDWTPKCEDAKVSSFKSTSFFDGFSGHFSWDF